MNTDNTVPAVIGPEEHLPSTDIVAPPADMRSNMLALPAEQMLAEANRYYDQRHAFRDWLKSKLVEGIHFGYPPALEPKFDDDGNMVVKQWDKRANNGSGGYKTTLVSPKAWTAKPSLYKAGADFVCDLLYVRDSYEADMHGWEQLGKPAGVFVYCCKLISRTTNEVIGEGRGVRKVGTKGGDENNAIKMAKKCAKVDAVLNAYGLADLFTQDLEEPNQLKPQYDVPEERPDAARAKPRDQRRPQTDAAPATVVSEAQFKVITTEWKNVYGQEITDQKKGFAAFVEWAKRGDPNDTDWNPAKLAEWTKARYDRACERLGIGGGE